MNQNSLQAYFDESNQRKFNSHKARIIRSLKEIPNQHSYHLSMRVRLSNEAAKKRITDLLNEGFIEVSGSVDYYGNTVSTYRIKEQLTFLCDRKPTLRSWMKENHPENLKEYDLLYN